MKWFKGISLALALTFGTGVYVGDQVFDDGDLHGYILNLSSQVDESFSKAVNLNIDIENIDPDTLDCDEVRIEEIKTAIMFYENVKRVRLYTESSGEKDMIKDEVEQVLQRAINKIKFLVKLC
jgi:hypothetical protein